MLRYVENLGLVRPERTTGGYRTYSERQLERLRELRGLVEHHGIGLAEAGFARRMRHDDELRRAVDSWLDAEALAESGAIPGLALVPEPDWLQFEKDKQLRLLMGDINDDKEIA